jgi:hypothetical protein
MTEKKASVTTEDINKPKKAVAKKAAPKKIEIEAEDVSDEGKFIIVFESGAGYATASGIHFSQTNKIAEVSEEEGKRLLELDNFRLPSDEEKELYYTNQED